MSMVPSLKNLTTLALPGLLIVACTGSTVAKSKKLTLEQAWAICKAEVDSKFTKAEHSARYAAGGACMYTHGYRI
jgi:hypothetical protein